MWYSKIEHGLTACKNESYLSFHEFDEDTCEEKIKNRFCGKIYDNYNQTYMGRELVLKAFAKFGVNFMSF